MQTYHAIFPGGTVSSNRNAVDWGQQGLLAYGACTYVVVADVVDTMKRIQTLDGHSRPVTRVRWGRENLHFKNEADYSLTLASGDEGGSILVWKVTEATIVASMNPGTCHTLRQRRWKSVQLFRQKISLLGYALLTPIRCLNPCRRARKAR